MRRYANYITFIIEFRLKTIIKIKFSSGNDRVWQPWACKVERAKENNCRLLAFFFHVEESKLEKDNQK